MLGRATEHTGSEGMTASLHHQGNGNAEASNLILRFRKCSWFLNSSLWETGAGPFPSAWSLLKLRVAPFDLDQNANSAGGILKRNGATPQAAKGLSCLPSRNAGDQARRPYNPSLTAMRSDYHYCAIAKERRIAMPTETAIIIAGIVLVFAVFAVSLAWADFYTRNVRTPGTTYFHKPK